MRVVSLFAGIGGLDLGLNIASGGAWETVAQVEIEPHAQAVLRAHWPHARLFGDIARVSGRDLPSVDLLVGGYPCFPAGTLIDTESGLRPIEEVREGERVLTHARRLRPVVATMQRLDAPLVEVRAMGAAPLRTTAEHPFYARRRRKNAKVGRNACSWEAPAWVAASDLTCDHVLAQPLDEVSDVPSDPANRAFWYLVGRWLGDGWIADYPRKSRITGRTHKVIVCCGRHEADVLAKHIARAGFHGTRTPERTAVRFQITSAPLIEMLRPFGRGAAGKQVPSYVHALPLELQRALWRGWIESDGHVYPSGRTRATTISRRLAYGMARVARTVTGKPATLHRIEVPETAVIEGRVVHQRTQFEVNVAAVNRDGFFEAGFCWVPVRSVRSLTERAEVYNLEVAEDNSYVAGSFAVHNCTGHSKCGSRTGLAHPESGLWREFARLIEEVRPHALIVENVPQQRQDALLDQLTLYDDLGYDAWWGVLRASDVGAPHQRPRMFTVAVRRDALWGGPAPTPRVPEGWLTWPALPGHRPHAWEPPRIVAPPGTKGVQFLHPGRVAALERLGNAVVPQVAFVVARIAMALMGWTGACRTPASSPETVRLCALAEAWIEAIRATGYQPPSGRRAGRGWRLDRGVELPSSGRMIEGVLWTGLTPAIRIPAGGTLWSTPTKCDAKNNASPAHDVRHSQMLNVQVGGFLSPRWTERLMGFPEGWVIPAEQALTKTR